MEQRGKVVIVDDCPVTLSILNRLISREGFTVVTVSEGKKAYEVISDQLPDIVILDLKIRDLCGLDIAIKLNTDWRVRDIPIIISSGVDTSEIRAKSSVFGCMDFVDKPINTQTLLDKINIYTSMNKLKSLAKEVYNKVGLQYA